MFSQSEPILYVLRFAAAASHYLEVTARFPGRRGSELPAGDLERGGDLELGMAVWTPGSYLIREFSRQVESLAARTEDGEPLRLRATAKNRWRVQGAGSRAVLLRYRLYCRELTVRTNYVDDRFALINGAATYITLAGDLRTSEPRLPPGATRPFEVRLELPAGWRHSICTLAALGQHCYRAESWDELVDAPIYAGNPALYEQAVTLPGTGDSGSGNASPPVLHRLVNEGEGGLFDGERAAADLATLARTHGELWGEFPYRAYTFFNLLTEEMGGLEHADSTVLMASRLATRTRQGYLGWLALASHELFHAWNGKRLRPVELGPFDYEREAHTESLWWVEGVTSYYDDLLVHRAGLSHREEYLHGLSRCLRRTQTLPGRRVQSLAESSFETWIKHYRRDEHSINRGVSYYPKGAVVAWLLDGEIRRATLGARSLDDVLRLAFERYSGGRGYTRTEIEGLASEVTGRDLSTFFRRAVDSREELEFEPALDWLGLRFVSREGQTGDGDAELSAETAAWLGIKVEGRNGALVVTEAHGEGPAFAAGLSAEDEILAIDGYRVTPADWQAYLKARRPGEEVEILLARQRMLRTLTLELGTRPIETWQLEVDPEASAEAARRRAEWLAPPAVRPASRAVREVLEQTVIG